MILILVYGGGSETALRLLSTLTRSGAEQCVRRFPFPLAHTRAPQACRTCHTDRPSWLHNCAQRDQERTLHLLCTDVQLQRRAARMRQSRFPLAHTSALQACGNSTERLRRSFQGTPSGVGRSSAPALHPPPSVVPSSAAATALVLPLPPRASLEHWQAGGPRSTVPAALSSHCIRFTLPGVDAWSYAFAVGAYLRPIC